MSNVMILENISAVIIKNVGSIYYCRSHIVRNISKYILSLLPTLKFLVVNALLIYFRKILFSIVSVFFEIFLSFTIKCSGVIICNHVFGLPFSIYNNVVTEQTRATLLRCQQFCRVLKLKDDEQFKGSCSITRLSRRRNSRFVRSGTPTDKSDQ